MSDLIFIPVEVKRGRKFKGFAYSLGKTVTNSFGGEVSKLWDPLYNRFVYATADFVEPTHCHPDRLDEDKEHYVKCVIEDTIKWCKDQLSSKPTPIGEVERFARAVLKKNYPEFGNAIDKAIPDNRDVVKEIEKTISWALALTTKAGYNKWGKWCSGGKPIPDQRKSNAAYNALLHKGINKMEHFDEIFQMELDIHGLPRPDNFMT